MMAENVAPLSGERRRFAAPMVFMRGAPFYTLRHLYPALRKVAHHGVRLEFGNYPTLSFSRLTGDFVPLSGNP